MLFVILLMFLESRCPIADQQVNAVMSRIFNPGFALQTTNPHKPHFAGVTGQLKDCHWVSADTFETLVRQAKTPYVGKLPKSFIVDKIPPKLVLKMLDELALNLQLNGKSFLPKNSERHFQFGTALDVKVKPIGSGVLGTVYQVSVGEHSFALKVFHQMKTTDSDFDWNSWCKEFGQGAFSELRAATFLSKRKLKDMANFYIGNPVLGWGLFEFIDSSTEIEKRSGKNVRDFYPGFTQNDIKDANSVAGVTVDYGTSRLEEPSKDKYN